MAGRQHSFGEEVPAMKRTIVALALLEVCLLAAPEAMAEWQVGQNSPDPFCNDPGEPGFELTWFSIWGEPTAEVQFEIWDPDTTGCLIRYDLGEVGPGAYYLLWHGTDAMDTVLPEGGYPYRLMVAEAGSDSTVAGAWRVAHISCDTAVRQGSWSIIKALYRPPAQAE
jgi:hypothetical protein